jgi:hypothetical protein
MWMGWILATALASDVEPTDEVLAHLRLYETAHLVRHQYYFRNLGARATLVPGQTSYGWAIFDGGGGLVRVPAFAVLVKDQAMVDNLDARMQATWIHGAITAGIGVVAIGVAQFVATSDQWILGPNDIAVVNAMKTGGIGLMAVGATLPLTMHYRRNRPAKFYSASDADKAIEAYNAELRTSLSLTAAQTAVIDGVDD